MTPFADHVALLPGGEFLADRAANSTSQFGEDGLIAACLERYGAKNQWCFEVGAHDGLLYSNTHRLRCEGWRAFLIEGDRDLFTRLCEQQSNKVTCINEMIGPQSIDRILDRHNAPDNLDLGVIDIDGQDYWCWKGMERHKPRLMLIEFAYGSEHNGQAEFIPPLRGEGQAGIEAIRKLGIDKGYVPLATTLVNMLFVRNDIS